MRPFFLFLFLFSTLISTSQVGINTDDPLTTLDVRGVNHNGAVTSEDGILVPRVNELSVSGSQNGQLVYLTTDDSVNELAKGFYYWYDTEWKPLDTVKEPWYRGGTTDQATENDDVIYSMGNVAIGTNYTTQVFHIHLDNGDSRDVVFSKFHTTNNNDIDIDFMRGKGSNVSPGLGVENMSMGGIRFFTLADLAPLADNPPNFYQAFKPAAEIAGEVDGTVTSTSSPGRLVFKTTEVGSINAQTKMVIKNTGKIGVGTQEPNSTLHVNGSVAANIRTSSGTIRDSDYTVLVSGNVTLPTADATNLGRIYRLINNSVNTRTITGSFSINGIISSNFILNNTDGNRGVEVQSDGASWIVISKF